MIRLAHEIDPAGLAALLDDEPHDAEARTARAPAPPATPARPRLTLLPGGGERD